MKTRIALFRAGIANFEFRIANSTERAGSRFAIRNCKSEILLLTAPLVCTGRVIAFNDRQAAHRGGRIYRRAASLAMLLFCMFVLTLLWGNIVMAEPQEATLCGFDDICSVGEEAFIEVKLEHKYLGFKGAKYASINYDIYPLGKVTSREDRITKGVTRTNRRGLATIRFNPKQAGDYEIVLTFMGDDDYLPATDRCILSCRDPKEKETIILDIDQTISDTLPPALILDFVNSTIPRQPTMLRKMTKNIDSMPLKDSVEVTRELAERYYLIYVTARPLQLRAVSKQWLKRHNFPCAPIYFLDVEDYSRQPISQMIQAFQEIIDDPKTGVAEMERRYKSELISDLKDRFENITIGIGNKRSDMIAYRENGMKAIIIGKGDSYEGVEVVHSWSEIREILLK